MSDLSSCRRRALDATRPPDLRGEPHPQTRRRLGKVFEVCRHLHGARNLQAPAFSPLTKLYYLGLNNSCMTAQVVTPMFQAVRGITGVTYSASLAPGYDYVGEFVAFDPARHARLGLSTRERRADDGVRARDRGAARRRARSARSASARRRRWRLSE